MVCVISCSCLITNLVTFKILIISVTERRKFISGFTGSAGTALVGLDSAYLWTDGRYFLQAEQELSSRPEGEEWKLMKSGQPDVLEPGPYIMKNYASKFKKCLVGVDSNLISTSVALSLGSLFSDTNTELVEVKDNLVDKVWKVSDGYPQPALVPCVPHPLQFAGKSHADKIANLQQELKTVSAYAIILSMLDEVRYVLHHTVYTCRTVLY